MKEWIVTKATSGGRLDKYLKARLGKAPDSFFYKMARKKNLMLNDARCTGKEILKEGDRIKLYVSDETISLFETESSNNSGNKPDACRKAYREMKGIRVLDEEEDLLFVYKPAGILSQKNNDRSNSLNEWLIGYLLERGRITESSLSVFRPSVLNRLDRNTCGIVLCSVTESGSRFGSEMLRNRLVRKFYRCLVHGDCSLSGEYDGFLTKDHDKNLSSYYRTMDEVPKKLKSEAVAVSLGIQPVKTLIIRKSSDSSKEPDVMTLLEIELHTGKSHQIRVMLAGLGYPVAGDVKYGNETQSEGQKLCAVRMEFPKLSGNFAYMSERIITCDYPFTI